MKTEIHQVSVNVRHLSEKDPRNSLWFKRGWDASEGRMGGYQKSFSIL